MADKNKLITSIITSIQRSRITPKFYKKRAPLSTFQTTQGSITIEAALAVPIFFWALLCVIYLLEVLSVQMSVRTGMLQAMDNLTTQMGTDIYITAQEIEQEVVTCIGEEKLEVSIIVDGKEGVDCSQSYISWSTGIVELHVSYVVQLPIPQFTDYGLYFQESIMAKGWTGYTDGVSDEEEETVYITDNQSVYHLDYNCSYLQLSIYTITPEALSTQTNEYGEHYTSCSFCMDDTENIADLRILYVTENSTHYHSSLSCSGLKRTIYAVSLSDVIGKGVCSRCGN